jgi:PleD family two-component response regulator
VEVLAVISDLFVQSRITEVARTLGITVKFVSAEDELIRDARSALPRLVILDLAASEYDPFSCARKLKTMPSPPKILAIFPHVRADLKLKADVAMIDYIVPNSGFLKTLRSVLEKEVRGK